MDIYYDPATEQPPVVHAGPPPADQSALVTQLQAQVQQLTADLATRTQERDARQAAIEGFAARAQARKDADAATVDGQADLDAAAPFLPGP